MGYSVGYTIGIDVGTTFTAAATCRDGRTEVATLGDRGDVIPSVAFLREDGVLLVGHAAERRAVGDATRVARAFKRRIGDDVPLYLGDRAQTAEALTAAIVRWVVDVVSAREGEAPDRTILTFPASWGDHRRRLLLGAAAAAGVDGAELLPEPVAAAIHYAARHPLAEGATVGIYDLGGGTFDATVVRRTEDRFEVVGQPRGDDHLGGIDLDAAVWDHVVDVVGTGALDPVDPSPPHMRALAQVRAAAVDAKEALSYDTQAVVPVTLPDLMTEVRLTRAEFEEMARPSLLRTIDVLAEACAAAGVDTGALDTVLLAGGSSRIPLIAQLIGHELRARVTADAHPKLATCLGAARAAAIGHPLVRTEPPASPADDGPATEPIPVTLADAAVVLPDAPPEPPPAETPARARPRSARRLLAVAAVVTLAAAAVAAGVLMLPDDPDDPGERAGGDRSGGGTTTSTATSTTTTRPTTTTTTTTTTSSTTSTTADGGPTSSTADPASDPVVEPAGSTPGTAVTESTTLTASPGPGDPCDPAAGDPDCVDPSGTGQYTIVEGYAACVARMGASNGLCEDLDGDGYAGYPDSG